MYSFPNPKPVRCSMSSPHCCFLTCIQVSQEAGKVVLYSHLFKDFPQFIVVHIVKGFGVVSKAEVDVFMKLSCFFYDPVDALVPLPFLNPAWTSESSWLTYRWKLGLENFEHYFTTMWDECNCAVVWAFFGLTFLWHWNENWPFPVLWSLLSFPALLAYWMQHFHSIIF